MFRYLFNRNTMVSDISAGVTLGFQSIPDGMAAGLLAGINPIYGVYGYMVGVASGTFFTSSVYMAVQGTSAMALIVASVPQVRIGDTALQYLVALSMMTGVIMLILGLLKLGTLLRFVPKSVMTGFISAIAILIVLGQLADLTGYAASGSNRILQTINLMLNLERIDGPTITVGLFTIILILVLEKTQLKSLGMVVALVFASILPPVFGWQSVALVRDIAEIPSNLPGPVLPPVQMLLPMLLPAFSLALVGLIQGAGISQNYANPDGKYPDASGDFTGQGIANIASGLFQGMPVGGSLSATSLVVNAGARTRFANIVAGITMAVSLLFLGRLIGALAMPALAGLLLIIGVRTLKPDDILMVWKSGRIQQSVALITFVTALLVPLQYAVILGVAISILLFVFSRSNNIVIRQRLYEDGPFPIETDAPEVLPANAVTILVPYGSLFFASAQLFEKQLPEIETDTRHAVVIINFRGRTDLGITFMTVLTRYAEELRDHDCRLILAGVGDHTARELEKTGVIKVFGRDNIFRATERVGESTLEAFHEAERWLT